MLCCSTQDKANGLALLRLIVDELFKFDLSEITDADTNANQVKVNSKVTEDEAKVHMSTVDTLLVMLTVTESHDLYEQSADTEGKVIGWLKKLSHWLLRSCDTWLVI